MPPAANDIVRLKSGASFRGALVEHDPRGRTLLQTDQGTRDFDSNDVAYAGPSAGDPSVVVTAPPVATTSAVPATTAPAAPTTAAATATAPPASSAPPAVTGDAIQLNATTPGVQFHVLGGPAPATGGARALCVAPCNIELPAGTYRMALSRGLEPPLTVQQDVDVRSGGTLEATYGNHKSARVGGVMLIVAGSIVTLAGLGGLAGSGASSKALGSLGLLSGAGGLVGGILLVRRHDEAFIRSAEADHVAPRGAFSSTPPGRTLGTSVGASF